MNIPFAPVAFVALGIERLLYGYCYICTNHFKRSVDENKIPGLSSVQKEGSKSNYWRCMQRLGVYIKVFQVSVCLYDLLVLDYENVKSNLFMGGMLTNPDKHVQLAAGMFLIFVGQTLNYAVFKALGAKGVYYGYEFGYHVGEFYFRLCTLHLCLPAKVSDESFKIQLVSLASLTTSILAIHSIGAWSCASLAYIYLLEPVHISSHYLN